MAEEFQNTISLYGPVEEVETSAQSIGASLYENFKSASTHEFILLWNGATDLASAQEILEGCLVDSIVFDGTWAKISLAFQTRRGPFPIRLLLDIMKNFPEICIEIETHGDCSGLTGILTRQGKNLALRQLDFGTDFSRLPNLFSEYFGCLGYRSTPKVK